MKKSQRWIAAMWMLLGAAALLWNWRTGNNFQETLFVLSVFLVPGVMLYAGSFVDGGSGIPARIPLQPWPAHRRSP